MQILRTASRECKFKKLETRPGVKTLPWVDNFFSLSKICFDISSRTKRISLWNVILTLLLLSPYDSAKCHPSVLHNCEKAHHPCSVLFSEEMEKRIHFISCCRTNSKHVSGKINIFSLCFLCLLLIQQHFCLDSHNGEIRFWRHRWHETFSCTLKLDDEGRSSF